MGRPAVGAVPLLLRVPPDELHKLDVWIAAQSHHKGGFPFRSRQAAIRWLVSTAIDMRVEARAIVARR